MGKCLITGINGFAGSYLAELLLSKKQEVAGTLHRPDSSKENIRHIENELKLHVCELDDFENVKRLLEKTQPDVIFHLAAQSSIRKSWEFPVQTINANITATLNIFEAIRKSSLSPIILLAGSSEEYGLVKKEQLPVQETTPLNPLSPYSVSKAAVDLLGFQYFKSYGLKVIRSRAFNHSGPRHSTEFADSSWCLQIVEIEKGKREPVLSVGNLEAERDFTDVRDTVNAYWELSKKARFGEAYNVCSGTKRSMKSILDFLLGQTSKPITVQKDPKLNRPSDVPFMQGDNSRIRKEVGWEPTISFEQMELGLLNYWRNKY